MKRALRILIVPLVLIGLVAAYPQPFLQRLGAALVVEDAPAPADAIVMLSGSLPDRILYAVDLYAKGLAPLLVLTRPPEAPGLRELRRRGLDIPGQSEVNRSIAAQLGVPANAILVLEQRVSSTMGEMRALVPELRRRGVGSILLVTSKTHSRRAAATFRFLARDSIALRVAPTPYDPFSPDDWWHHRAIGRRVVTEYAKLAFFELVDRWRVEPVGAQEAQP